ncbi:hypothetical protein KKA14_00285 [bacterium]|nr:hypothetical protein [bacterium]
MKRVFLKLYLILAIANGLTLLVVLLTSDKLLENVIGDFSQYLFKGTFYLITTELESTPVQEWDTYLAELNRQFLFPVTLVEPESLDLSVKERETLTTGNLIYLPAHLNTCQLIRGHSKILCFGPVYRFGLLEIFLVINAVYLMIGVAISVLIWVRPLWVSLMSLHSSAVSFGQGKFDTRAHLKKTSIFNQLATTFNLMADRIQQSIQTYQDLTNSISHELRTPIARLKFGMEMLQHADDKTAQRRYLESMSMDVNELDTLVSELLTYAEFDPTLSLLELEAKPFIPWFETILRFEQKNIQEIPFTWSIPSFRKEPIIKFDDRSLQRAISNILRNASQYAVSHIEVLVEESGNELLLHFDDDGPGIPEKEHYQLFEAFKRLENDQDNKVEGHGLGLAIVKRIITQHNGDVRIARSPLNGARFTLSLPMV